jgi:inositol transport system ATP-binding protein
VAEKQIVEIVKAISYNADIIIMDEPTSAITDREVEKLFEIIRKLVTKGKAIIYISHKLDEIFQISDCITVMRDGAYIDTKPSKELDKQKLINLMVGRELSSVFPKRRAKITDVAMEVKKLNVKGRCKDITFKVRRGEILGVAGLMGAGRTEAVEAIFGARKIESGEIIINGESVNINSPKDAISKGIALVTEDRKLLGLNLKSSVKNNITLANLSEYCRFKQIIKSKEEKRIADTQIDALKIKTPDRNKIVNSLSGGNQQKVVIAKWLLCNPDILILDEPTRGIDVGAKAEIYKIMNSLAEEGKAVIMISSEMPEILGMSDRVIVLHEGRITGEFDKSELDQEKIMLCATGHEKEEAIS